MVTFRRTGVILAFEGGVRTLLGKNWRNKDRVGELASC